MRALSFTRRSLILVGVAGLALIAGMALSYQTLASRGTTESGLSLLPPPQSMDQLVEPAHVIVVGTIGDIVDQGTLSGYNSEDKTRNERPNDPVSPAIPITDFRINIERVLLDDGTIQAGKPLILRMLGEPTTTFDSSSAFPQARVGERYLLVLSRNPDGATYGPYYGPYSRLVLGERGVTYSDGPRTVVGFTNRRNTADFMNDLIEAINRKQAKT